MLSKLKKIYNRARLERARARQRNAFETVRDARIETTYYNPQPRVGAILQHFNKKNNIRSVYNALSASGIDEIIFIDDGSVDGSFEEFVSLARGKNEFVIRANDLFEVRTYDRAISFCRAEYIILLQDDDLPPANPSWVSDALEYFAKDPLLGIIGGRSAIKLRVDSSTDTGLAYESIELSAGEPLLYVEVVNRAPMILRKSAWQQLEGIDQAFAPFQCDDVDMCLKAWKAGMRVGLMHTDFIRDIGVGGMRLFNAESVPAQALKNWGIIRERHAELIGSGWYANQVAAARGAE